TTTPAEPPSATTRAPASARSTPATSRGVRGSTCPVTATATRPTSAAGSRTTSSTYGCRVRRRTPGASSNAPSSWSDSRPGSLVRGVRAGTPRSAGYRRRAGGSGRVRRGYGQLGVVDVAGLLEYLDVHLDEFEGDVREGADE